MAKPIKLKAVATKRMRTEIQRLIKEAIVAHGDGMVGIALVLWDGDGTSTAIQRTFPGSNIPRVLIPEFVKLRLLGDVVEGWVIDRVNND